eukprot:TRINITY_DN6299_c0_g1_i1.p1 TRINITY_DN6299_c0_g1~~TRINITY_DN6299_c0_g1_i1.p1  ORF type:complete len:308 (+),score=61.69 TRINITY_DN6299_c0_g1_i1:133-924(+)
MTYNVLCQGMINRNVYPYCTSTALRWKGRRANLEREFRQLQPDIACLQECDNFESFWQPLAASCGYHAVFLPRPAPKPDGLAVLYKHNKFKCQANIPIHYNDIGTQDEDYDESEMKRNNIAQLLVLNLIPSSDSTSKNGSGSGSSSGGSTNGVIIGNTHLFWNYRYPYVRLRQACRFVEEAHALALEKNMPFLMCGDWNCTPDTDIYKFMTKGMLPDPSRLSSYCLPIDHNLPSSSTLRDDAPPPEYAWHSSLYLPSVLPFTH